jgi:hypothetical protein
VVCKASPHGMATPSGGTGLETTFTAYKIPLSAVAKWPAANFSNPERRQWLTPYSIILYVLATLVVVARLWTRLNRQAGGFGWDDALILLSWVRPPRTYLLWYEFQY